MRIRGNRLLGVLLLAGAIATAGTVKRDEPLAGAREAFESSDYGTAAQILQAAAAKDPQNAEIQLLLAKTYYELQEHDAAIARAEKAVALEPGNSVYHEWLGRTYGEKAEHASLFSALSLAKRTRKEFETAVKLDGNNFSARQALIEYDCSAPGIAGGGEDKARPQIAELASLDAAGGHFAAGNCRRQKKDFAAADEEFTKALASNPKSAELVYDIGDYAMKRGQAERLLAVADAGELLKPADPRGKFYRAVSWILEKERPEEAEMLLKDYLKVAPIRMDFPHPADAHYWLGLLLQSQEKTRAAVSEYKTAMKLDPKNKNAREALKKLGKN
ncbi:MAG TPA: tetratricopeptide repeat protein [Candidatus Acidoferrum sp.]|jgi:tetratricopeptide (TPR) repeat protein|nr:tetratricopeptide repeat protein [Candidatus Acidoferrum sp.]